MEDMEWSCHLARGREMSEVFNDDDVSGWRAILEERELQMNCELVRDLTGDLAATTAWNALTHVSTSRRANVIFVSRDAHANTGYSDTRNFIAKEEEKMPFANEETGVTQNRLSYDVKRAISNTDSNSSFHVNTFRIFTELCQQSVHLADRLYYLSRKKTHTITTNTTTTISS